MQGYLKEGRQACQTSQQVISRPSTASSVIHVSHRCLTSKTSRLVHQDISSPQARRNMRLCMASLQPLRLRDHNAFHIRPTTLLDLHIVLVAPSSPFGSADQMTPTLCVYLPLRARLPAVNGRRKEQHSLRIAANVMTDLFEYVMVFYSSDSHP